METTTRMATQDDAGVRGPGRPRDPGTDRAILEATLDVLAEVGYVGLTLGEVARRAGVGRPTLYRRWPSKARLVVDAMATRMPHGAEVAGDTVVEELRSLVGRLAHLVAHTPLGRVLPGLVAEMAVDPELADVYRGTVIAPQQQQWRDAIRRGVARGELAPDTDVDLVVGALAGPVYLAALVTGDPLPDDYAERAVALALTPYLTSAATDHRPTP